MNSNSDLEMMLWGAACMPNEREAIMQIPSEYLSDDLVQRLNWLSQTVEDKKVAPELATWFLDKRVTFSDNKSLLDSVSATMKRDYERAKLSQFAGELGYAIKIGDRKQLVNMMKGLLRDLGEIE